ncbi:MAG TPA: ABC transporter permease [Acetobacteraceae bacterium]|nr:ABC transporter permease [Acetobacteraceae bacterium]
MSAAGVYKAGLYRALLRCYPAAFREEYGGEMLLVFSRQMREAGGLRERARIWMEAVHDAVTVAPREHWHVMMQDIRYALRGMAARPGFTAVAIISLALGIGANTAIFGIWNGLLHAPLPGVSHPEQLVILSSPDDDGMWHGNSTGERSLLTYEEFEDLRDHTRTLSAATASESSLDRWPVRFAGGGLEEVRGRLVAENYFEFFGVGARLGRVFAARDANSPHAVLSYAYWQRRFGGAPDVVGKTFTLRGAALTILGVASPGFIGETAAQQPDLWIPIRMQTQVAPGEDWLHDAPPSKTMWLHVFGRLKPGVAMARAEAEANAIFKAGLESFYGGVGSPERRRELLGQWLKLHPAANGASTTRGDFSTSLTVLLAAVGVLLLIACANLANLLLARGEMRRPEMALRISLGASRGGLVRQLVTESLVLAALGALGSLALARLLHGGLTRLIVQSDHTFHMEFRLDPLVLAFAGGVALAVGLLFGLLPAWQATRRDAASHLKEQGRSGTGRMRWGRPLVSLQLALSLPLLAGAGLLARTVYNLQHVDLGYPVDRLWELGIDSRIAGYNSVRSQALFRDLLERIRRIPGVQAVSFSHNGLFTGSNSGDPVEVEGYAPKNGDDKHSAWDIAGPDYFSTVGIPILLGRDIQASDDAAAPKVCVVNEAFAKHFFAGRNPIGLHVTAVDEAPRGVTRTIYQVVGVVKDAHTDGLRGKVERRYYVPFTQPQGDHVKRANFVIRSAGEHTPVLAAAQQIVQRADAGLPILYARSMPDQIAPNTATERATAQVAITFAAVALALAAIGLFGVLSYTVARRRSEFAIRIALGARPERVVAMVLRETGWLIAAGLALGAGLTYTASRWIASVLYGVAPQDPITLACAVALLVVVALAAVCLPAWRASKLDPMATLRQE